LHKFDVSKDSIVINGKLIVIDLNKNRIDPVFSDLPKRLKPESPEQVKTVLWIKCNSEYTNLTYTDGTQGLNTKCELTFIDFVNKQFLWRETVTVSAPDYKARGSKPVAPDPNERILQYLEQIAQKE
jgi:hypothetical protein